VNDWACAPTSAMLNANVSVSPLPAAAAVCVHASTGGVLKNA